MTRYSSTDIGLGNLYSEKVTKRDLFFVFQRYGRLAQISIKNAYGFIQFYEASCSNRAIQGEQGSAIRGRKIRKRSLGLLGNRNTNVFRS